MEDFVHKENLKLYRKLLAETTDEQKRQTLLKLLADEEAKDAPRKKAMLTRAARRSLYQAIARENSSPVGARDVGKKALTFRP